MLDEKEKPNRCMTNQNPAYNLKCKYLPKDLQIIKKISIFFASESK
jgi:hypothetical protein